MFLIFEEKCSQRWSLKNDPQAGSIFGDAIHNYVLRPQKRARRADHLLETIFVKCFLPKSKTLSIDFCVMLVAKVAAWSPAARHLGTPAARHLGAQAARRLGTHAPHHQGTPAARRLGTRAARHSSGAPPGRPGSAPPRRSGGVPPGCHIIARDHHTTTRHQDATPARHRAHASSHHHHVITTPHHHYITTTRHDHTTTSQRDKPPGHPDGAAGAPRRRAGWAP